MANNLFDSARQRFLEAQINWMTDTVKVILVTSAYVVNTSAHQYLSDISGSARATSPVTLTSKSTTGGAADGADCTFTAVSGSTPITSITIYIDTGSESTSPLIAYIDTATGLPITPNGGDIIVTWDNGVNRIFRV